MGERSLKQERAAMEAKAATLKAAPHVIYGAKVYGSKGNVNPENAWTCVLEPPYLGAPSWVFRTLKTSGPTPQAVCEEFDRLWEFGDLSAPDVVLKRSVAQESIINEVMGMRGHHTQSPSLIDVLALITSQAQKFVDARRVPPPYWKEAERRHLVGIAALAIEGLELIDREEQNE